MNVAAARRVLLLLTVSRWFPVGLVVAVLVLLMIERGLSVGQALTVSSLGGVVVFLLELPTAGLADALGRKPLLLLAAGLQVVAAVMVASAQSFAAFAVAAVVTGAFRALDSGPLQAWFVDTVHRTSPGADVDRALSQQSAVLGLSIALGALVSGGLVWWHPVTVWSALTLPYVVYAALAVVHLVATAMLLREARPDDAERGWARARREARRAPHVVADGLRLARGNRVLLALLLVEVFWAAAMVVFESLMPVRLGEVLGSTQQAGALMGVVASVGWAVFAAGAGLAGWAAGRFGVARTALAARVLNGLGAVWMGLVAGPAALVSAYLVTYGLHGSGGPVYEALLHREATAGNRATVLSMASMLGFASFAVASPALGWTAEGVSTPVAMMIGGAFSVLGAFCFLPAWRREKQLRLSGTVAARV
ncbi:major facilitator superfamily MFS_1 [Xylanimonas cellulosilytica DSM 15894]|uniref:Major facilitator superfamily MFS_1 n=1 Tax=Xylanimonas cellulosilytica (strain DSM 15894 / JCM 12276 / CECT 5975 / KCTC 9989 / LMG 20990 / NBRC 107835 / XIL07) TaxID=446471 RepID=D1BV90_XYLCX|nr:MFS transporter [Xylanimonas cellulosilytica]ACZ29361.1 major facilitator superfamily MFS_1 [Xylanimonas cellulosilytica DSM 15894]